MALTLNQFVGFETGGLEEASATTGSPDATEATIVRSGDRALLLPTGTEARYEIDLFGEVANAGNSHIVGFGCRIGDLSPASTSIFGQASEGAGTNNAIILSLDTNGDVLVRDVTNTTVTNGTITSPLTVNTWHYFELYFQNLDSGAWELLIDGLSVGSGTGEDFTGGNTLDEFWLRNSGGNLGNIYFDDFYWLSGATAASDRYGPGVSVYGYQTGLASATPDFDSAGVAGGNALDAGNWNNAGERVWSDTNVAQYTATAQLDGCVAFNDTNSGGDGPGPSSGSEIVSGTIKGAKFAWRGDRSGGSGTTHSIVYGKYDGVGNMDDAPQVDAVTLLSGTLTNFFRVTETATRVPTASEDFVMGLDKSSGGRDWDCYEMQAFLLHVSSVTVTDLSDGLMPEYPSHGLTLEVDI